MYKLLVRPHLEYAAQIWNPHLVKNITKLEDIQKFALRMCCKNWDAGYQELLDLTTMPTLENRRLYVHCTRSFTVISISHPMFLLHSLVELLLFRPSLTNLMPIPNTISHHLYIPSTISVWNNLPHTALTAHTTQSFKAHITPFFVTVLTASIEYILELAVRIAIMYPLHYYYYCFKKKNYIYIYNILYIYIYSYSFNLPSFATESPHYVVV